MYPPRFKMTDSRRLSIESASFWISWEMLFAVVDMASHNSVFVGNCGPETYTFLLMMLHWFSMWFKSGDNGGHAMLRPFLKPIFCIGIVTRCLRCKWRGIVMHKNNFPFEWQIVGFEPLFEMFVREGNVCHRGYFYTFRNFLWANRLITNDPSPKHDAKLHLVVVWHEWDCCFHLRPNLYSTHQARQALLYNRL